MPLKQGGIGDLLIADARGLAVKEGIVGFLRPDLIAEVLEITNERELVPGEEVEIAVPVPGLKPNANVRAVTATLFVRSSTAAVTPDTTEVEIRSGSGAAASSQEFGVEVKPANLPRNIQVRLAEGAVFWTHSGTIEAGEYALPDFAVEANAYLDRAAVTPDRPALAFMVRSETPGRVRIEVGPPDYTVLQTETWENPLDGTVRIDRNLELDFGGVERIDLDTLADPEGDRFALERVTLDVTGELGPERLLGDVATHDGAQFTTISPDYSVAQRIRLDADPAVAFGFKLGTPVRVAGLTGVVQAENETELYVEVRNDGGGKPAGDGPLATRTMTLEPAETETAQQWLFAAFESPAALELDRDYWVVFRGIRGRARLGLTAATAGYLGRVLVNRGGQLWKTIDSRAARTEAVPRLASVVRLVYLPEPDSQTAAIALALEGDPPALVDPEPTTQRITVEAATRTRPAALVVTSNAKGSLTLANVVQEFAEQGASGR
jgi:hypothetical protein